MTAISVGCSTAAYSHRITLLPVVPQLQVRRVTQARQMQSSRVTNSGDGTAACDPCQALLLQNYTGTSCIDH
jgi:hypothetical protein